MIQTSTSITPPRPFNQLGSKLDTDSVFFSATPVMDVAYPGWNAKSELEIVDIVNDIAQQSQDYLNSFYDIMAKKFFNVGDTHRFEIKKEYVAKAGFWVAKKRYAQWILSDNGVAVDKLDVKGLDVKRSSFPTKFQVVMKQVLLDILSDKSEREISQYVLDFKNDMRNQPLDLISKNSAVKNIKKYTEDNRRPFQMKKGTPAHVKASIRYNDMLLHFKVPFRYPPIRDGDKIKWTYVKTNPLGIDSLAFTGHMDPPEILEFLETYIDRDRVFECELQGKLQDFFDALGYGSVISKHQQAAKFFSF